MRFPIDAVFLSRELQVLKVVEQLRAWRTASSRRARAVLELAAGEIATRGIEVGDHLGVVEVGAKHMDLISGESNGRKEHGRVRGVESLDFAMTSWTDGAAALPAGHAVRVLVVGSDRRFRAVAAALLARRGYSVAVGERGSAAAELVKKELADVVVLGAGTSLTAAAREAAQIETLDPPV